MIYLAGFIVLVIFVYSAVYSSKFKVPAKANVLDNPFDEKEIKKRKEQLDKTLKFVSEKKKVTTQEVQKHLKISETDAIRYLEHLVSFGKLAKINERGQKVLYEKV